VAGFVGIRNAAAPRETEYQVYDGEILGLALRVNPNSRKVYTLFYRTLSGRKRTLTLGVHGAITPEQEASGKGPARRGNTRR
jgi:hypothetical protein